MTDAALVPGGTIPMLADVGTISSTALSAAAGTAGTKGIVKTMKAVVGKICTTSTPLPPLSIAPFATLPGVTLAPGGRMPIPANLAFASPTARETVPSATIVGVAKGRGMTARVVAGKIWEGGWSVSIESEGRIWDGLLLELELEPVWVFGVSLKLELDWWLMELGD